jgi:hypothetical protein
MGQKEEFAPKLVANNFGSSLTLAGARLKKLRKERRLVERAIVALTEVSRSRESRERRAIRD